MTAYDTGTRWWDERVPLSQRLAAVAAEVGLGRAAVPELSTYTLTRFEEDRLPLARCVCLPRSGRHHGDKPKRSHHSKPGYVRPQPQLGEMRISRFLDDQARQHQCEPTTIRKWIDDGRYEGLAVRRVGPRNVFVRADARLKRREEYRRQSVNGLPTKVWVEQEAARLGITVTALKGRLEKGTHKYPEEKQ